MQMSRGSVLYCTVLYSDRAGKFVRGHEGKRPIAAEQRIQVHSALFYHPETHADRLVLYAQRSAASDRSIGSRTPGACCCVAEMWISWLIEPPCCVTTRRTAGAPPP
eukprot:COSAG01_NODE_4347_length_5116_cov_11.269683_1_plen_106_part_10